MPNKKSDKLLHVLNGAIRSLIITNVAEKDILNRYKQVMKKEAKDIKEVLIRIDKASLIKIVDKSPEITEELIEECFEEYRYSRRPSFRLFLWRPADISLTSETFITSSGNGKGAKKLNKVFEEMNFSNENIRGLIVTGQTTIDSETIEVAFAYQERQNYIDPETEDNNYIFGLKYGFLWVNVNKGFLSISVPTDSLALVISRAVGVAFRSIAIPINITERIVDSLFEKESMKRTSLFHPNPPPGMPERISIADSNMGQKIKHLSGYSGYESPSAVYEEQIEDDFFSTLGVNCDKGKIYLTRQLKASQLRHWGLWRIHQIMGYINGVYNEDNFDELFDTIGIKEDEDLKIFAYQSQERQAILEIVKALLLCKKKSLKSYMLINYNTETLHTLLKRYSSVSFQPHCEECGNHTEVVCKCCGRSELIRLQTKNKKPQSVVRFVMKNWHWTSLNVRWVTNSMSLLGMMEY